MLASCAAVSQLLAVRAAGDHASHTSFVFLVAAALLLPPKLVALMGLAHHSLTWRTRRRALSLQAFAVCTSTIAALAAQLAGQAVLVAGDGGTDARAFWALSGLAASLTFVAANGGLAAGMLAALGVGIAGRHGAGARPLAGGARGAQPGRAFHDIGKLAVPEAVLLKPAPLDPEEWALARRHPGRGRPADRHARLPRRRAARDQAPPRAL